ncbi:uncharacterized protein LOC122721160 [Apis laboriosa]|uniref:uncharacterized protein LOC122721160 n=1 Tax=Apis laboriosa TaxID=183418 RepID=UPI001CC58F35|nr:uncharacterized protein LOC122721160 [Apis laboriosa]
MYIMQISSAFVLFVFLTMALSGTYTLARPNDHVGEKHLKSSPVIKNIAKAIHKRSISRLVDDKLIDTTFEIGLSKFEAIKAIELAILRMLSSQIDALTTRVQKSDVLDLLNLPIIKFITEEVLSGSLLSDKNDKNISPSDFQQQSFDETWLRENIEIPVIHENTNEKLSSMKPSLFEKEEESLPVSNEEFPVQKF